MTPIYAILIIHARKNYSFRKKKKKIGVLMSIVQYVDRRYKHKHLKKKKNMMTDKPREYEGKTKKKKKLVYTRDKCIFLFSLSTAAT